MRRFILLMVLVQILGTSQAVSASWSAIAPPEPEIALGEVILPERVLLGGDFVVNISVTYSCRQRTMSNIGIYDSDSGKILDPRIFYLEGDGSKSFLFKIQAPPSEGESKFEALMRYWYLERWVYEDESLQKPFSVKVTDKIRLSVILPAPSSRVKVDSVELNTDHLGVAQTSAMIGRHLIEVPQKMSLTDKTRLGFLRWSDGSVSNPRVVETQDDTTLTAEYETEHYLSVGSSFGHAQGEGWYPAGSTATFSVPNSVPGPNILGFTPEEYTFTGWRGDTDAVTPTAKIKMTSPKTVEALWQTDQEPRILIALSLLIIVFDGAILGYVVLRRLRLIHG